jgi:hypothetical protein
MVPKCSGTFFATWHDKLALAQTEIQSLFWRQKMHFRAKMYSFPTFILINFLVWTLQCTETFALPLKDKKTLSIVGYFIKIAELFNSRTKTKPKSQFLFQKNSSPLDLYTMTLPVKGCKGCKKDLSPKGDLRSLWEVIAEAEAGTAKPVLRYGLLSDIAAAE